MPGGKSNSIPPVAEPVPLGEPDGLEDAVPLGEAVQLGDGDPTAGATADCEAKQAGEVVPVGVVTLTEDVGVTAVEDGVVGGD